MPTITAKSQVVYARDNFGRFIAQAEAAADRTVERTVEYGARVARNLAPAGKHRERYADRPGYVPLKRSIRTRVAYGAHRGYWYSIAPHAMYVEAGTNAHLITGRLTFFWKGGYFYWNNPRFGPVGSGLPYENWTEGTGAWVRHPGTRAQPFLMPSYLRATRRMMSIAKSEYPG